MAEGSGTVASDVVQRRLAELFAQMQAAPTDTTSDVGVHVEARNPQREISDDEEWLSRLRPATSVEPEPAGEGAASRGWSGVAPRVVEFTRAHLTTVVVVLLVGVAWTAYSMLQARATPVADAAPRVQASPVTSASSSGQPAPTGSAGKKVLVHVIGAVVRPGVVALADGARVSDAIAAAGGLTRSAALGELNLAQPIGDGTQLKIGTKAHPGGWIRDGNAQTSAGSGAGAAGAGNSAGAAKVSLNKATLQQLDSLPGVGPVTAQKILDWRAQHGRFTAITELQEVDGIGPKTYADLADRVQL